MVGYRRPKNLRDLLVEIGLQHPQNPTETNSEGHGTQEPFLLGETHAVDTPGANNKQFSVLNFMNPNIESEPLLKTSTSAYDLTERTQTAPTRSKSLTQIAHPNLLRNGCIAKKQCIYCPVLNITGTIKCHGKTFCTKKNITCISSYLI